jgi:hypothetical protein
LRNSRACQGQWRNGRCRYRVKKTRAGNLCGHCLKRDPATVRPEFCYDVWCNEPAPVVLFKPHDDHRVCSGECQPDFAKNWVCLVCFESPGHFVDLGCNCRGQRIHYECMIKCPTDTCPTCRQVVDRVGWRPARGDLTYSRVSQEYLTPSRVTRDDLTSDSLAQGMLLGTCAFPTCRAPGRLVYDNNVAVLDCQCDSLMHPRCAYAYAKSFGQCRTPCICSPLRNMRVNTMIYNQIQGCAHTVNISSFILNHSCSCKTCPCKCLPCCVRSFAILSS